MGVRFLLLLFFCWTVLAHLSWKLKWAILIACCPSSVRLSVNFYISDFFSRTTRSILTKFGTNHPWGKGILNCTNEGDWPFSRGDNHKRVKIHWNFKTIFFSRTIRPISIKLGIIIWHNVDSELFTSWSPGVGRGHNRENYIYICLYWKNLLLNQQANFNQTWHKSSLGKGNYEVFK
jgi:hypothetical protein